MTRTPLDGRPLRDRLLEAAAAPTAAEPITDLQKSAYADGQGLHAEGSTRPNVQMAGAIYGDEAPWFIKGWDAAAEAAVEPATFVCRSCKDEEYPVVPGEDDSVWCVCGVRLDEQRERIADEAHHFETEGRQDQRTVTRCAVCGLDRSATVHR